MIDHIGAISGTVCNSYYYYTFESNQTSLMVVLMEFIIEPDISFVFRLYKIIPFNIQ